MKILAVAAAFEAQRFTRGYPPKGAWLFLRPDLEISRLANLCPNDLFVYLDERVDIIETNAGFDLTLVRVDFNQEESARLIVEKFNPSSQPVLLFGPQVTAWQNRPPDWVKNRVLGDITNIWDKIRVDALNNRLQPVYLAPKNPNYTPPRSGLAKPILMNTNYQAMFFVRGCACPKEFRHLCPEYLYYQENVLMRSKEEIIGEVLSLPGKHIHLLDEDITRRPDYYYELFRLLWSYRRHWTVNASDLIFNYPNLIRLLAKAGTKIIFLNESFLVKRLSQALKQESVAKHLYRQVKYLQSRRLLVGAKLTLPATTAPYAAIADLLCRIDLDFIEIRFTQGRSNGQGQLVPVTYHPALNPDEPAWIKSRFYALNILFDRFFRRPRRVGFHSTGWYLIPYSFAYRQNFLEGLPYP